MRRVEVVEALRSELRELAQQNERLIELLSRLADRDEQYQEHLRYELWPALLDEMSKQTVSLELISESAAMLQGLIQGGLGALDDEGKPLPSEEWFGRWRANTAEGDEGPHRSS